MFSLFSFSLTLSVFPFSGSIKTEKSAKKNFLPWQKMFSAKENIRTRLNFGEILFAGTKFAVLGGQYRFILPTRFANQNTEFAA